MESLGALLPILLIGAVFYLLIMRPARNRQKQQASLLSALNPGASIMTTAGVFGTITAIDDDNIMVEVAPGVELRMVRASVGRVLDEPSVADVTDFDAAQMDYAADEVTSQGNPDEDKLRGERG